MIVSKIQGNRDEENVEVLAAIAEIVINALRCVALGNQWRVRNSQGTSMYQKVNSIHDARSYRT